MSFINVSDGSYKPLIRKNGLPGCERSHWVVFILLFGNHAVMDVGNPYINM